MKLDDNKQLEKVGFIPEKENDNKDDGANGPLGEWPDFTPIGFITAPHPDDPNYQTHLYGDWGGIVGEEFIFQQDNKIKMLYHSYHETYLTEHPHQEEILQDWTLGYDPITKIKYTPLVSPGGSIPGPAWQHTDTPSYIQHPITGEHLLYNTVRPGSTYLHPEWEGLPGWEGAIQVATSTTSPVIGIPFMQTYDNILIAEYWWEEGWNQDGVITGGLSEPTPVWVPHLGSQGKVRLFYRGLHGSPGSYWNWRISYADSEDGKTGWVKNPVPTFDPSDSSNPAYQWTLPYPQGFSFRGSWQAHCTGDIHADGVHMVLMVSNQNYAGSGHIAYYWSPDWGDTWIGHPDNPIIAPGQFPDGVPSDGFQRTPTLLIDEEFNRYILAYNAGHDIDQKWKRRTYLATASRPQFLLSISNISSGWNLVSLPFNLSMDKNNLLLKQGDYYYNWTEATSIPIVDPNVYGWDRILNMYVPATTVEPGYGYWIYAYGNCEIWAQNISITADNYITELDDSWNIIGVPSLQTTNLSDLIVNYLGVDYTWVEATNPVNGPIIDPNVYGWDRILHMYVPVADTLEPGYSYWMYAYQPCTLKRVI